MNGYLLDLKDNIMDPQIFIAVVILGGIILYFINKDKDKPSPQPKPEPVPLPVVEPEPTKPLLILDTDMSDINNSDPDDGQAVPAQAVDLRKYKVIVISTNYSEADPRPTIRRTFTDCGIEHEVNLGARVANYRLESEGARAYIEASKLFNPSNRLQVEIWGPITTFAQAVRMDPTIVDRVEVFWVGSTNRKVDVESFESLKKYSNRFPLWRDEEEFRGIMEPGVKSPELESLHKHILNSPAGEVYKRFPIWREPRFNWKAGDLSLYFYREKKWFREVFTKDIGQWKVANGIGRLQGKAARDVWIPQIKKNADNF